VGVDGGGADIFVAQQFLDGANVVATFEQVGGEAVTKGVATGVFVNARFFDGRWTARCNVAGSMWWRRMVGGAPGGVERGSCAENLCL
jgi:hypothetical protein